MPTTRQRKAAKTLKEVIEGKDTKEGGEILDISGYSEAIQKNPGVVFNSKGFQEALKQLGFSLEAADMTVAKILQIGKEENRLRASDQIYKRLSGYAPEKHIVGTVSLNKLLDDAAKARS